MIISKKLTVYQLFTVALALRYAQANADDIEAAYEDPLAEGQEGKGVINLTTDDASVAGAVPDASDYEALADLFIGLADKLNR